MSQTWLHENLFMKLAEVLNEGIPGWINNAVSQDFVSRVNNRKIIKGEIEKRVYKSDCIIILAGVYLNYQKPIRYEFIASQKFKKPIVLIEMFDDKKTSDLLRTVSDIIVDFDKESIISAIKKVCSEEPKLFKKYLPAIEDKNR